MNTNRDTSSATNSMSTRFRRRIGRAPLALLVLMTLALTVPVLTANGQGQIQFNNRIATATFNQTGHIWGPSTSNPALALIGLGSNDSPSGTTAFGAASGMAVIGQGTSGPTSTNQDAYHLGYCTTFAQLIGAVGQNMPESTLVPLAGVTTFRTGSSLGCVAPIYSTFTNNPASIDAPWATVEIVAWDNGSGQYPTWTEASAAWQQGLIAAGHSAAINVANISGTANVVPYLTSAGVQITGFSFNLHFFHFSGPVPVVTTGPASTVTATNATLNGTVNPNGYLTAAWFQWGTTTSYGNLTPATDMGSGTNALSLAAPLPGLTPGTAYHFRVAATNSFGAVYGSDQSFTTLGLPGVSTLSATAVTATNATLNATVNPNGYVTTAWFQWGTTTDYGSLTSVTGMGSGTNALPLAVPLAGLAPGVMYHFRVAATNSPNAVYGSDRSFTTATLPLPQVWTLSATAVTATNATLNATVNPNGYLTGAWFEWGTTTNYGNLTSVTDMGSGTSALPLSAPLAGLAPGVMYHFRVAATNSTTAGYGSDQSFTTATAPPVIVASPASLAVPIGARADFQVEATGSPPLVYQWVFNGTTAIAGATSSVLSLANVQLTQAGPYSVTVTNLYGAVTSGPAVLTVNATYPTFSDADWVSLGSGMGGYGSSTVVYALAVSGTNLYVGGFFSTAGGVSANNIAKWNGSAWSALGSGMGGSVFALAVSGANLYAGGNFTTAGGVPATNIARWDGTAWSALGSGILGSGMNGSVRALAVSGGNLYAGGMFTTAGGLPANNIAKWNGWGWSALGLGVDGIVYALAMIGTDLYAGGRLTPPGGVPANGIAKWNGSAWSALDSGMSGVGSEVDALAVIGTDLYAGGYFTTAGGVDARYIAKWNGNSWSALGSGMNGYGSVWALAVSGTDLYAGGLFTMAGGVPANYIAKWNGWSWSALGSGIGGANYPNASALAADGAGHLFAGGNFTLAGTNVCPYIAQANLGGTPTNAPPVIVASPASLVVPVGAAADFLVQATGSPLLVYQWVFNGTNAINGATSPVLSLANVQLAQAGAYSLTIANLYGAATSAPAVLTVTGVPPVIVASPASLVVPIGAAAGFLVQATGSPPLVYQWVFDGTTAIAGATSSVLSLTNVQLIQAGAYSATVSNLSGAVTSAPAVLEVLPPGPVLAASEAALRAAMAGGGIVTFACDGTITLASTITNDVNVTLDGTGHQVAISGGNAVRVFTVNTNVSFTVVNLTIADGTSLGGSAILNLGGTVNLTGVTFRSNTATINLSNDALLPRAGGGAIFNRGGTVNASNCSFENNTAQTPMAMENSHALVYGGAIRNEAGQVNLQSCAFVGNRASGGASSWNWGTSVGDPGMGGAIHNSGTVTLDLCTFAGNSAAGGAGSGNPFGFAGFSGAEGSGGAIFNQGTLTVGRTTLCNNTASGGSGSAGSGGTEGVGSHPDGYPGGDGGGANGAAICNLGSLWITQSTFAGNAVTGGPGGAGGYGGYFMDTGGNGGSGGSGGSGLGGALLNSGSASIVNCTIAFNTGSGGVGSTGGPGGSGTWAGSGGAGGSGGSGFGGIDGTCNLTNCTIAWNVGNGGSGAAGGAHGYGTHPGAPGAPGANGAAWGGTAYATLVNTLIASNTPAGDDSFPDAKLGPLANNGGPTLTMALLPGSPAIDAGDTSAAPATDQRGFPRPAGLAADIGAFEYGSVMPTLAISRSGPTGLNILGSGNAGRPCRLLTSMDLLNWLPLATNQIGGDGTILFYDTCAPGSAGRFYRLVMP